MATIKELKEFDAKATSAPWYDGINSASTEDGFLVAKFINDEDMNLVVLSRNALPDLIRVIELAEEAMLSIDDDGVSITEGVNKIKNALSEIKKLKGE